MKKTLPWESHGLQHQHQPPNALIICGYVRRMKKQLYSKIIPNSKKTIINILQWETESFLSPD